MTTEQLQQIKTSIEMNSGVIEGMLEDYSLYVDERQANFIRSYTKSLVLDFEAAMTRGEDSELVIILEDLEELRSDTATRLKERMSYRHEA
jgi:hypothetical protein